MSITALTATAIMAGVSFVTQALNTWRNNKCATQTRLINEEYERAMRQRNADHSARLLQKLLDTRAEISHKEREEALKLLQITHDENIKAIAEKTFFSKWPLHVHPIVIRNDYPLLGEESFRTEDSIEPVHIIVTPTRDASFRKNVEPEVTDRLCRTFADFYNARSSHRVIFYKDAWIDETADVDETDVRNIYSRIRQTPTIVIGFKVKRDRLVLEISYWGMERPSEANGSDGAVFCQSIDIDILGCDITRDRQYGLADVEIIASQLTDFVALTAGMFVDRLMWHRYQLPPVLPSALRQGIVNIQESDLHLVYDFYTAMLRATLESGTMSKFIDYDRLIPYCLAVDSSFGISDCLSDILFEGRPLDTFNLFPAEVQYAYLQAFAALPDAYSSDPAITRAMYDNWFRNTLWTVIPEMAKTDPAYTLASADQLNLHVEWKSNVKMNLYFASHALVNDALRYIKTTSDGTMRRIAMREWLGDKATVKVREVFENACDKTVSKAMDSYHKIFSELVANKIAELKELAAPIRAALPDVDFNLDYKKIHSELVQFLDSNLADRIGSVNASYFCSGYSKDIRKKINEVGSWKWKIAEEWIEYKFMGTDIIKRALSGKEGYEQNRRLSTDFKPLSDRMAADFIAKIKNIDAPSASTSSPNPKISAASFMLFSPLLTLSSLILYPGIKHLKTLK